MLRILEVCVCLTVEVVLNHVLSSSGVSGRGRFWGEWLGVISRLGFTLRGTPPPSHPEGRVSEAAGVGRGKLRPLRGRALSEGVHLGRETARESETREGVEMSHDHQSVCQLRYRPALSPSQEILEGKGLKMESEKG